MTTVKPGWRETTLRVPIGLQSKLTQLADRHRRSINQEMLAALDFWLEHYADELARGPAPRPAAANGRTDFSRGPSSRSSR